MSMYNFTRLIKKYSGQITAFASTKGEWVNGKWVDGEVIPQTRQAALIPFDVKTIAQLGGLVTNADMQLYSLSPFAHGDKIEKNGQKYTVDTSADFTQFDDFYRYIAKGVSSFD